MKAALAGFLQGTNGQWSSMRLAMLFTVFFVVPGYLVGCALRPDLLAIAAHVFLYAGGLCGIKAYQRAVEPNPEK